MYTLVRVFFSSVSLVEMLKMSCQIISEWARGGTKKKKKEKKRHDFRSRSLSRFNDIAGFEDRYFAMYPSVWLHFSSAKKKTNCESEGVRLAE